MARSIWTDTSGAIGSYTTGGITVATSLTTVDFALVEIDTTNSNLSIPLFFQISRSGANFTYKIMVHSFDKLTAIGNTSGLPSGVTSRASSGGTYDSVTHNHSINHDHAATTSGGPTGGTAGSETTLGSGNYSTHTHSFDVPSITVNSGNESAHTHTWDNIYQHQHSLTNTSTDGTLVELPNGTTFGATRFNYLAVST